MLVLMQTLQACFGSVVKASFVVSVSLFNTLLNILIYPFYKNKIKEKNKYFGKVFLIFFIKWFAFIKPFYKKYSVYIKIFITTTLFATATSVSAITIPGTTINNTATASFSYFGNAISIDSNTITTVSTIIKTPSKITLFQYDHTTNSSYTPIVTTQHATAANSGFINSPNPTVPLVGTTPITLNPNLAQPLIPVKVYATGEPIFIQLEDLDQNLNPNLQETVQVQVTSSTGDTEELILIETGANTGIFVGYIQSSNNTATHYNGLLTLGENSEVKVFYTDQYDTTDKSTNQALVDPFGLVFSSSDGTLIDGATVTLLDKNGNVAAVFGDDGISHFDNPVTTGGTVTDSSGQVYNFLTGAYRFPRLVAGEYQLIVVPPSIYTAPSTVAINQLQILTGAPFVLNQSASYAKKFSIIAGAPLHIDIPVDASTTNLLLEKKVSKKKASIGDFVQYDLTLSNIANNTNANDVVINDILPIGLRYQKGSLRYDNKVVTDPKVSDDGQTLSFTVKHLAASKILKISYVTEITSGTKQGKAINTAIATDIRGVKSNQAQASLIIDDDLYSNKNFIVGRVILGDCQADGTFSNAGLPSASIFMENGSYAVTDENGRFHFEGVSVGSHVVQLDVSSLPENLEVVDCIKNTRYAQNAYSQFVDLQGGTLWQTNFYVREKKILSDKVSLFLQSDLYVEDIKYSVKMTNGKVPVKKFRLIINLPKGIRYTPKSSFLNDKVLAEPEIKDNMIIYRLGNLGDNWQKKLNFRASLKKKADGDLLTSAYIIFNTKNKKNINSSIVKNTLKVSRIKAKKKQLVFQAYFNSLNSELSEKTKKGIDDAIKKLDDVEIKKSEVIGFSDSARIRPRSIWLYENNTALSKARAKAVQNYLTKKLGVKKESITIKAEGDKKSKTSNITLAGRSINRRAELIVTTSKIIAPGKVKLLSSKSKVNEVTIEGGQDYKVKKSIITPPITEQKNIENFDNFWLKKQKLGYQWLMPDTNYSPNAPTINIAVKHKTGDDFKMKHNGEALNPLFYFGKITNKKNKAARSYWQGVHLKRGKNIFEFFLKNKNGKFVKKINRTVMYSDIPVRAELEKKYSRLIADGRIPPVVALRIFDKNGDFARPGSYGDFSLSPPFISEQEVEAMQDKRLTALNRKKPQYIVGQNGIAYITLAPTRKTGKLEIDLPFAGRKNSRIQTWMQPEERDWILVGIAEGNVAFNEISGNKKVLTEKDTDADSSYQTEGKVAFYAKGKVKGKWLLTAAYDSDKKKSTTDNRLDQLIDPNTYYTIYGDNSLQRFDASSAKKLYIKIEREQFYALFGDMQTGLNITELSKFTRKMTGFKSEYDSEHFSYTAFAAESLNNFVKNEIQGDGTSGLYHLSEKDIVINSEKIVIETRDRFRGEIIKKRESLRRFLDYTIDYTDGTIYFKKPIQSRDANFNPIFIVADYEVETPVSGDITAGARVVAKFNKGKTQLGITRIHDASFDNKGDLTGADTTVIINDKTEIKLEVASTEVIKKGKKLSGSAYSAEVVYGGDDFKAKAYAKQQDADFGLGQQSLAQLGTRKIGADIDYRVNDKTLLGGSAYHENNLITDASRDVVEANIIYAEQTYSVSGGAKTAKDTDNLGNKKESNLLLLGASKSFFDKIIQLRVNAEVAVDSQDNNSDHPTRYILGADYFITSRINLFAENEWTFSDLQDTRMSRVGFRSTPWKNAQINSSLNKEYHENGLRSFATLGLTQAIPISERWSGDISFDKSKTIKTPGATNFNNNVNIAQGSKNDFTAISLGATYQADSYTINNRIEARNSDTSNKTGLIFNWERNLQLGIAYSAAIRYFAVRNNNNTKASDGTIRFSLAYRPLKSRLITLNRLDYIFNSQTDTFNVETRQRKLIDNLAVNFLINAQNQLAFNSGLKYVIDDFDKLEYRGATLLLGTQYRHDFNEKFDFGLQAHGLKSFNSNTTQYSTGLSVGWNMARNIWLSVGYNVTGFTDRDFSVAEYTQQGPYVRFRVKFDQDSIKNWLRSK